MAKNLIPKISKMLGVELGEEFKITGYGEAIYKFTNDGLVLNQRDGFGLEITVAVKAQLDSLLNGKDEIIKLPWKPKERDIFYSFGITCGKWVVRSDMWAGVHCNYALFDKGWVYRTRAEAEENLLKVAKEYNVPYSLT